MFVSGRLVSASAVDYITVDVGDTVTFPCAIEVAEASPPEWFKDGSSLDTQGRITVTANRSIVLSNTQKDDEGNFTCQGRTGLGVAQYTVILTVQGMSHYLHLYYVITDTRM